MYSGTRPLFYFGVIFYIKDKKADLLKWLNNDNSKVFCYLRYFTVNKKNSYISLSSLTASTKERLS